MIDKDSFTKCNISEIIEVIKGDIIELAINKKVDAIVNAAKPSLMGGNGVDGAIHEKMSKLYNDSNYFNKQIKRELDGEKELADNAVRCKRGEAKITNGHIELARYIIHAVGPKYDGGSECIHVLQRCYENIMKIIEETPDIEKVIMPVISSGNYGFPFTTAFRITLASINNQLLKWKEHNVDAFNRIKKIYIVIYGENSAAIDNALRIYEECEPVMQQEKRMVYINGFRSQWSYCREIWKNDSDKRYYFTISKMFRWLLAISRFVFFPSMFVRNQAGKKGWKFRREAIEIETFLKMLIPLTWLVFFETQGKYGAIENIYWRGMAIFITIWVMADTVTCLLALIFLADIQGPSANQLRSLILLIFNYLEMVFGLSLFYYLYCHCEYTELKIGFWNALDYGVLGAVHSAVKISSTFRIIEYAKSGTNFLFMALAFGFFSAHLKQRSYLSDMEK